ncbi:hypothetical protein GPECTOR_421g281 [Gonium pectorale]|uniref:Uncharacterized protein n=1 Tax=Gonium pectorale TaxID=33097 RepID=A0A150FV66_GONPE|nr:hypothetical protein GPECTOR_421g281 [Gonium pectorale]|eukprot:KXZ41513.1 hypothetical protein GPECTOR_421g281 [Gonium pectorale]
MLWVVGLMAAVSEAGQSYDISRLQLPSPPLRSPLPLLVLGSAGPVPNEPKGAGGLLVAGCSGGEGGGDDGGGQNETVPWTCCLGCSSPGPALVTAAGVEIRGRSSQAAAKKSFSIELRSFDGSDSPHSLLGLPAGADWVLAGLGLDRSLLRDGLAALLARAQGRWAPRSVFVELFVVEDGAGELDPERHYRGVYALTESIERAPNRVDVQALRDKDPRGGWILELNNAAASEWWAGQLGEQLPSAIVKLGPSRVDWKYPEPSRAPPAAWRLASSALTELSTALSDWGAYSSGDGASPGSAPRARLSSLLDLPSAADWLLHTELACDYDGFVSSVYLHRDRTGPLVAGPVWDKNLAYGNEAEVTSPTGCGWRYAAPAVQNSGQPALWFAALAHAGWWRAAVAERWRMLRSELWSDAALGNAVDSLADRLPREAVRRNFNRWPLQSITTNNRFVTLPPSRGSWQEEVSALRSWLLARARWLDGQLLGPGGASLAAPQPPNLVTGVLGAVMGGRTVLRAFQEGSGIGG